MLKFYKEKKKRIYCATHAQVEKFELQPIFHQYNVDIKRGLKRFSRAYMHYFIQLLSEVLSCY